MIFERSWSSTGAICWPQSQAQRDRPARPTIGKAIPRTGAVQEVNRESVFAQAENSRRVLCLVEAALLRIEQGGFGKCVHCGNPISRARLRAVPWANSCVGCQEALECNRGNVAA